MSEPEFRIVQTNNLLALRISVDEYDHSAASTLVREFLHQHEHSELVVIEAGGYYSSSGVSTSSWEICNKVEVALPPRSLWAAIRADLRRMWRQRKIAAAPQG